MSALIDLPEIDRFEQAIASFNAGEIDTDRFTAIRLQYGAYGQRQEGVNMLRIKVPGGRLNAAQLDAVADITATHSQRGIAHFTTRQAIQVHFIPLAKIPSAMRHIAAANLTSREACGNAVRNMTGCALAGVCPKEHLNIADQIDGAVLHFLRNPLNQQLPRKFKISFSACESDCAQSLLHDAGVVAVKKDGQHGFMIKAGGGLGHKPREAIVVDEFIPDSELLFALEALVTLHNKYSDRTKRAKSRIKFLVEKFGKEGFISKYRAEFERTRVALANQSYPKAQWREQTGQVSPGAGAPRKLFAQHQAGRFVLPIALPIGDITPVQLRGLAALLREHGLDEVHTTQDQNLIILNVLQDSLPALRAGLAALNLFEPRTGDDVVACPGTSTCRLGITASTQIAPNLSGGKADLRLRVSGCHNGCAQPETGDIGIYGEGKRLHGKLVPHYQMYFAGNGTGNGALALKGPTLPVARIKAAIERVQQAHLDSGIAMFADWARAQAADYFKTLLADLAEVKAEELQDVMRDYGDSGDFRVLQLGGGECAGATQVLIGANFFEAAHEREYRNALVFQRKYDDAAVCNAAILRLLGAGTAQLMGGFRQESLADLGKQLSQYLPADLLADFNGIVQTITENNDLDSVTAQSTAVDRWTHAIAAFASQQDGQLDLSEALPT